MKRLFFVFCFFSVSLFYAQKEWNVWYFGWGSGLDFNAANPTALTNGILMTEEGCASICNTSGNILFYTDGITVYNKFHLPMQNGTGLNGHTSSTQAAVIVPKPNSDSIYYIFTSDAAGLANGLQYSEVDMRLGGGLGAITANKNILLQSAPISEKIAAVGSSNGEDVWIITTDLQTTTFYAFLVTANGVNTIPVISTINTNLTWSTYPGGYLKSSPDGTHLILARGSELDPSDLLNFDTSNGIISLWINLPPPAWTRAYGAEFSPDGTKLYIGTSNSTIPLRSTLYQYDLSQATSSGIITSCTLVDTLWTSPGNSPFSGALQLGPDKKIYIAKYFDGYLACINHPDSGVVSCGFVNNAVYLSGRQSSFGLPGSISNYKQKKTTSESTIIIPNVFTPNEDGINDVFIIKGLKLGVAQLTVLNRWGTEVYRSAGYNNDWNPKGLSDGTYYYILDYAIDRKVYYGHLSVLNDK